MAANQPFRKAFRGFNREDVVNYIEYLNNRHNAQMEQLYTQLQTAQAELANAAPAQDEDLQAQLEAAQAKIAELEAQLAERQEAAAAEQTENELEAYRRAERAERMAQERAAQIYVKANAVLADATVKMDTAVEQISAQLQHVQETVASSKALLQDATTAMYAIRPEEE